MAWAARRRIGAESAAKMNIDRSAELAASVNMEHGPSALWAWMVVFSKSVVLALRR